VPDAVSRDQSAQAQDFLSNGESWLLLENDEGQKSRVETKRLVVATGAESAQDCDENFRKRKSGVKSVGPALKIKNSVEAPQAREHCDGSAPFHSLL